MGLAKWESLMPDAIPAVSCACPGCGPGSGGGASRLAHAPVTRQSRNIGTIRIVTKIHRSGAAV